MSSAPPADVLDVVVVGRSLTGCLCAVELRKQGLSVCLLDYSADNDHLERLVEVPASPINQTPISGVDFRARVNALFKAAGIVENEEWVVSAGYRDGAFSIVLHRDRIIVGKRLIFAPAGTEVGAPELGARDLYGGGVSLDAWSDAPLLAGSTVAILGSGLRAAEEGLLAAGAGVGRVVIICEATHADFGILTQRIARCSVVEVWPNSSVAGFRTSPAGRLDALHVVDGSGGRHWLTVTCLFLARGLQCDWSAFNGPPPVGGMPGLTVAGLANGVPYDDYPAMIADAHRAVVAALH